MALDDLVKNFDEYLERARGIREYDVSNDSVNEVLALRQELSEYADDAERMKRMGRAEERITRKYNKLDQVVAEFEKSRERLKKKTRKSFDNAYFSFAYSPDVGSMRQRRESINKAAEWYMALHNASLDGEKREKLSADERVVHNYLRFIEKAGKIEKRFEDVLSDYANSRLDSREAIREFIRKTEFIMNEYDIAGRKFRPKNIFKRMINNGAFEYREGIRRATDFMRQLEEHLDSYSNASEGRESLRENNAVLLNYNNDFDSLFPVSFATDSLTDFYSQKIRDVQRVLKSRPRYAKDNQRLLKFLLDENGKLRGSLREKYEKRRDDMSEKLVGQYESIESSLLHEPDNIDGVPSYFSTLKENQEALKDLYDKFCLLDNQVYDDKTQRVLEKVDARISYFQRILGAYREIVAETSTLQTKDTCSIDPNKFVKFISDSYLRDRTGAYQSLALERKKALVEEEEKKASVRNRNFCLPVYIEALGYPDNPDYYKPRSALLGDWDKRWAGRLERFVREVARLQPAAGHSDIEYMRRLGHGIEEALKSGTMEKELRKRDDREGIVTRVINAINDYLSISERNLGLAA